MKPTGEVGRIAGLDGLRGLAVAFVVIAHTGAVGEHPALGGVGVDIFFVLSGYLITSLLITEHDVRGRIDLGAFWVRRACRLLPALFFAVTFVEVFSLGLGKPLGEMFGDWLAQMFYASNWYQIAGHPVDLMGHTWSLAVEEQFYLIWPLVVVAFAANRTRLAVVVAVGIVASVAARLWLLSAGAFEHVERGTDTRGVALLAGCALALAAGSALYGRVGWVALLALAAIGMSLGSAEYFSFGGLLALPAAVAAVAWSSVAGITCSPVVRLGERSYGVYLWHLPLLWMVRGLMRHAWTPGWAVGVAIALAVTAGLVSLSWRLVEVRAQAWGRRWSARRGVVARMPTHEAQATSF